MPSSTPNISAPLDLRAKCGRKRASGVLPYSSVLSSAYARRLGAMAKGWCVTKPKTVAGIAKRLSCSACAQALVQMPHS